MSYARAAVAAAAAAAAGGRRPHRPGAARRLGRGADAEDSVKPSSPLGHVKERTYADSMRGEIQEHFFCCSSIGVAFQ